MAFFEPEFTQPDDLIQVDGNYYGVFNVQGEGYSMPVLVYVDDVNALLPGAKPSFVGTQDEWEEANGRLFVDIMDYSSIKNPDNQTWEELESALERELERTANKLGEWIFEDEIINLYTVSALSGKAITSEDLENTNYFLTTSPEERKWMQLSVVSPAEAQKLLEDNIQSFNTYLFGSGITGEGINALSEKLSMDVSSGKISSNEAINIVRLISDPVYRSISGGDDTIPEAYKGYTETINSTKAGTLSAEGLITEYVGKQALDGFRQSGLIEKYAGMLRLDAQNKSNIMQNTIIRELQTAHDKLFPHFAGAKHSTWSGPFYEYFGNITKTSLSADDKVYVDNLARDFKGDFTAMGKKIRGDYIDTPGVKNDMISNMGRQFQQDLSAAY